MITSAAGSLNLGCLSTGIPLPLSEISIVALSISFISTLSAYPATTSSIALSRTSLTK